MNYDNVLTKTYRSTSKSGSSRTEKYDCGELISSGFINVNVVGRTGSTSQTGSILVEVSPDDATWTTINNSNMVKNTHSSGTVLSASIVNEITNTRYVRVSYTSSSSFISSAIFIGIWY